MATVKYAVSAYTADGVTTDYLITWDYLDEDHIAVYVDGTSNADPQANHTFTKLNNTTLRITDGVGGAIASGAEIEIRRETPLLTRAITFADGSALLAEDLNKNSDYLLYSMQEVLDTVDAAAQDGALAAQVTTEALRDETQGYKDETLTARNTTQGYLATVQSDASDADDHRIAAAASEAAALVSRTAAGVHEANSATSAQNSSDSAAASAVSAAESLASEQAAAVSEAASLVSQNAASASEAAALASQNAAAISETNAETAFDSLDDRYLGAKATEPTVDNDGDSLLTGALYWNSTLDTMYVWNGSSWDTFTSTTGIADAATSTALTIDNSGNVLVGKAASAGTTAGAELRNDGYGVFTRDAGEPLQVRRLSNYGSAIHLLQDTTSSGTIGVSGANMYHGSGDTGLKYYHEGDAIHPYNPTSNANRNGAVDLGMSAIRFRDAYLSGGVKAQGTSEYTGSGTIGFDTGGKNISLGGGMEIVGIDGVNGWDAKAGVKSDGQSEFRFHAASGDLDVRIDGDLTVDKDIIGAFTPYSAVTQFTLTGNGASRTWGPSGLPANAWVSMIMFISSTDSDQSDHYNINVGPVGYQGDAWGDTYPSSIPDNRFAISTALGDSQGVAQGHYGNWQHVIAMTSSSGGLVFTIRGTNAGSGVAVRTQGYWR